VANLWKKQKSIKKQDFELLFLAMQCTRKKTPVDNVSETVSDTYRNTYICRYTP
jgi:hypothetical protein